MLGRLVGRSRGALGLPLGASGRSRGALGAPGVGVGGWGVGGKCLQTRLVVDTTPPVGAVLAALWALLAALWALLGAPWALFWALLGALWALLGALWWVVLLFVGWLVAWGGVFVGVFLCCVRGGANVITVAIRHSVS